MKTGIVRWFSKSYGFITGEDGQDVFVHQSSIVMPGHRTLEPGQRVEFSIASGEKGLRAIDVKVVA